MSSDPRRLAQGFILLGLLAALSGCGKQGPPLPPLRAVPAPAKDLHLRQQGARVLFELSYPKTTASGMALDGVSAVEVWETAQPAPREGKPQPLDPRTFASTAKPVFKLTDADLGGATFGDHLIFSMPLPEGAIVAAPPAAPAAPATAAPATPATPRSQARFYAVRTFSKSGERSEFSNQVSLIPKTPPAAPDQLTTTPRPDGVMIEWSPVEGALGYAVYRRGAQEKGHGQPVHAAAPTERSWLDTTARFGQSYIYAVTSFNDRDPFIESAITSEREVRYQDRFAPPAPTDLVALAETGRIRLVWKGSDVEDLAGYVVYRRGADGDFQRITPQPLTAGEYVDTDVKAGTTYSYRVTAIDQTGNESAPGGEVRAALP
jgi:predicted small lipoprotein YifL